jgi:CubicO group peptidase (beta-lactamase class C family)
MRQYNLTLLAAGLSCCWAIALEKPIHAQERGPKLAADAAKELIDKSTKVDELLNRWISKTGPGAAVMVIHENKPLHTGCYGRARLDTNVPIRPTTNFRLASLTKQFTGMAIAMLMEDGKLHLDERLTDILTEQTAREVRVGNLLYHTSGLREYGTLFRERGLIADKQEFWPAQSAPPSFEPTNDDVRAMLKGRTLANYPPGRVFKYNNTGYIFLAAIIEKKSCMKYDQFLQKRIFKKLGMKNTFVGSNPVRQRPDLAYSYDFRSVATRQDIDYSPLNKTYGEDGVYSNLEDLLLWNHGLEYACYQTPPRKVLVSDDKLDLIFQAGTLDDDYTSTGYGFGWGVEEYSVSHSGAWLGFRTFIRRFRADRFTIIVLSNYAAVDVAAVADAIDAIYYPRGHGKKPARTRVVPPPRPGSKLR